MIGALQVSNGRPSGPRRLQSDQWLPVILCKRGGESPSLRPSGITIVAWIGAKLNVFEEYLCCRTCAFQSVCWATADYNCFPCGRDIEGSWSSIPADSGFERDTDTGSTDLKPVRPRP